MGRDFFAFESKTKTNESCVQNKTEVSDNFSFVDFDFAFSKHKIKSPSRAVVMQNKTDYQMKIKKQFTEVRDYSDIDFSKTLQSRLIQQRNVEQKLKVEPKLETKIQEIKSAQKVEPTFIFDKEIECVINIARAGALFD